MAKKPQSSATAGDAPTPVDQLSQPQAEAELARLAAETPASFVAFDLLALGD